MEQLIDVNEFAQRLNLKTSTIRRWLLLRKIASVKLGKSVRIPASEVDRLVQEGERPAVEIFHGEG